MGGLLPILGGTGWVGSTMTAKHSTKLPRPTIFKSSVELTLRSATGLAQKSARHRSLDGLSKTAVALPLKSVQVNIFGYAFGYV